MELLVVVSRLNLLSVMLTVFLLPTDKRSSKPGTTERHPLATGRCYNIALVILYLLRISWCVMFLKINSNIHLIDEFLMLSSSFADVSCLWFLSQKRGFIFSCLFMIY
jgi:hypothetical protein